jgi:hypothetical protein
MIVGLILVLLFGFFLIANLYGVILCFKAKWYIGVASLLVPGFATIVGTAKLIFRKNLLIQ